MLIRTVARFGGIHRQFRSSGVGSSVFRFVRAQKRSMCLLFLSMSGVSVLASTITLNELTLVNESPMKIGVNLSTPTSYDSGQFFKNLLYTVNPGFEGFIQQEIVGCISGSTTTCVNNYQWDQAPANYWAGHNS